MGVGTSSSFNLRFMSGIIRGLGTSKEQSGSVSTQKDPLVVLSKRHEDSDVEL